MPLFEYACTECGHTFEALLKNSAARPSGCPGCGSRKVRRGLSTFTASVASAKLTPCSSGACPSGPRAPGGCSGGGCPFN